MSSTLRRTWAEIDLDALLHNYRTLKQHIGEGVKFERIRRITGYLVGTIDRFNNGKRAEVMDRVKHGIGGPAK